MKKSLLALLIVLIAMMLCIPVSAQSNVTEFTSTDRTERSDDMDDDEYDDDYDDDDEYDDDSYDDDWSGYYNSFTYCQYLFDNYEADLEPYISGSSPTNTQKWKNVREDIRREAAYNCGYIMSVIEPDEWSDYVDELTFGAYYQLTAVEMLIQSIDNGQDQMLYNMHMQMRESADEMLGVIPQ